ncbi:hypothetical protein OG21DRAFT_695174 [Imleria badia]|nr:hypothetical protein OG21DRAFT_695174 [Imleria badia]
MHRGGAGRIIGRELHTMDFLAVNRERDRLFPWMMLRTLMIRPTHGVQSAFPLTTWSIIYLVILSRTQLWNMLRPPSLPVGSPLGKKTVVSTLLRTTHVHRWKDLMNRASTSTSFSPSFVSCRRTVISTVRVWILNTAIHWSE